MAKHFQRKPASRRAKTAPARHKAKPASSEAFSRPKIPVSWRKDFQLVRDFRLRNHGKWPSRDSKNPTEVRLANWIRSNLELLAAGRLPPEQVRMINGLVTGSYKSTKKRK